MKLNTGENIAEKTNFNIASQIILFHETQTSIHLH